MNRKAFYGAVRQEPFDGGPSQGAVDGINTILPAFETFGDREDRELAAAASSSSPAGETMSTVPISSGST